ncbi:MAG: hypothetical protein NT079_02005 [Candidatus Omnitrophica bacterium]|nr:hypothetical protein [Candidatus Omnitrophota bacterium]
MVESRFSFVKGFFFVWVVSFIGSIVMMLVASMPFLGNRLGMYFLPGILLVAILIPIIIAIKSFKTNKAFSWGIISSFIFLSVVAAGFMRTNINH